MCLSIRFSVPMLYSIYRSNDLKNKHELETKTQYDVVIRSRMDSFYREKIPKNEIAAIIDDKEQSLLFVRFNGINRGANSTRQDFHLDGNLFVADNFAFGSSHVMNIYSGVYLMLSGLSQIVPAGSEFYLGKHISNHSIRPTWSNICYDSLLGVETNRIQIGSTYEKAPYDELKYIPFSSMDRNYRELFL